MQNAVLDEIGVRMGGNPVDALNGAALVNGHVHQNTAGTHGFHHLFRHQLRCFRAGNQHAAHHQVRFANGICNVIGIGQQGLNSAAEEVIQVGKSFGADVQDGHIGTHAHGNLRRVGSHISAAHNDHIAPLHSGNAAQENAPSAAVGFQKPCTGLNGQPASHLAHRRQQREASVGQLHRLIGNGRDFFPQKGLGLLRVRRQMQIGEEDLPFPEQFKFRLQRFFDLNDHIGGIVNRFGRGQNLGTYGSIFRIGKTAGFSCGSFQIHFVASPDQCVHSRRSKTHSPLLGFDLFGTTDTHNHGSFLCVMWFLRVYCTTRF